MTSQQQQRLAGLFATVRSLLGQLSSWYSLVLFLNQSWIVVLFMSPLIAQGSSSNCIFFSSPYALVIMQALPSKNSTLAARVRN